MKIENNNTIKEIVTNYGLDFDASEAYTMLLETSEQEGDIVISDFISNEEDIAMLEAQKELLVYNFAIRHLDNPFLQDFLKEHGLTASDIEPANLSGSLFVKNDNSEAYYLSYQLYHKTDFYVKSFKL